MILAYNKLGTSSSKKNARRKHNYSMPALKSPHREGILKQDYKSEASSSK